MPLNALRKTNQKILHLLEHLGLGIIAIATVIAAASEIRVMFNAGVVTLADLLLLFLYLEVLAMVTIYYEQGKLPIRFPIYIGIIALARYLVLEMKNISDLRVLVVAGAILILAISVYVIRYGHVKFPYGNDRANE